MESFMKEFDHLKIQLEYIKSATDDFSKTKIIGGGGFGEVYGGELSHFKGRSIVAIKRLNIKYGQGTHEFWKEITILSHYTHENLISLLGFCIESKEMILVYEYASKGSLDRHLRSTGYTWRQRLKTCLDGARGLSYLHDANSNKERVIHCDIKSANILLDANWNAKVSDMGLSKLLPANQQHNGYFTSPVGTRGYIDPEYVKTGFITKESDVYSFGVLLFEVLCGRVCFETRNGQISNMVHTWKESYKQNKLQEIIFDNLKQHMDQSSLKIFADIAFKCLQISREERPTMRHVVKELETALKYQELYENVKLPTDYQEMLNTAAIPLNNRSESELKMLFVNGILINGGKTWFSLDLNGDHREMISIAESLASTGGEYHRYVGSSECNSRFAAGCYEPAGAKFKTHVRPQFLSPQITYTVNLVFKRKRSEERYIGLEYKLDGEKRKCYSFVSDEREDGWLTAELYQFTSAKRIDDLEIVFFTKHCKNLQVEGIEFQPVKKVSSHTSLLVYI